MEARIVLIHALTPLHPGTGQGVGAIDLPIAREKGTGFPYLPGSSLKGALRDAAEDGPLKLAAFGPEASAADEHAGALAIGDARLLLLPVRSLKGTFAWVTSPIVLARFARDLGSAGVADSSKIPDDSNWGVESCQAGSAIRGENGVVYLEDLNLKADGDSGWAEPLGRWLFRDDPDWQRRLSERLCVVHDDVLGFLARHATEVVARVALREEERTVQDGALWYEEFLPAETVLVSLIAADSSRRRGVTATAQEILDFALKPADLWLGGKAGTGRGRCRLAQVGGSA